MSNELTGSNLTRAMLDRGDKQVWCATSNDSDEDAMATINSADYSFLRHIISFDNNCFFCKEGHSWQHAVPVKKIALTQDELGL
ncbi:hypothetical protein RCH20_001749 [Psychrobacter sp. PL15]|uniref:hypothetical protein n=1 Tax=Psychrobacter sp. PL15 TaxID=3071719 RepID=UPI002E099DD9|nr:hypothetical protein [Psychrobacter sp. PL15]